MRIESLVKMANEVAAFFDSASDPAQAANDVAAHLRRFWDPRMRRKIVSYAAESGEGLVPLAREAVALLAEQTVRNA